MASVRNANKWLVTAAVMLPTLVEVLDTSVANVSLSHIQGSLSAGKDEVTWILTSYLVANAVVIPMSTWLAKVFGRKLYLILSLVIFTASSILCGLSTSLSQIIFFRIIQGMGGGGLQPMSQAILLEAFPAKQRGMALAIFAMGVILGPILGPLVGGYITDMYSWRWIFFINLPIGIVGLFMIRSFVSDPKGQERWKKSDGIDVVGLVLLTLGIGCLQVVLDKGQSDNWFSSEFISIMTVVSVSSLIGLVFWELTRKNPVLNLRVFKDRSFTTSNIVMFLGYMGAFSSMVLLPMYLQDLMGYTAFLAGLVLGPGGFMAFLCMPIVGKLTEKVDARFLLACGLVLFAVAMHRMSGFNLAISFDTAVNARVIQGVAMPLFFVPLAFLAFSTIPKHLTNTATAIFNLVKNLGGSFGVALATTLLARRAQHHQVRLVDHLHPAEQGYNATMGRLGEALSVKFGQMVDHTGDALAAIHSMLLRKAALLAYGDTFQVLSWAFVILVPLAFVIRKMRGAEGEPPPVG